MYVMFGELVLLLGMFDSDRLFKLKRMNQD